MEHTWRWFGPDDPITLDEIRQTGLYAEHPTDVVYLTRFTGHELARLNMPAGKSKIEKPGPWGDTLLTPEPMHRSNQFYFEPLLKTHADSYAKSDIRFGWQLTRFEDFEDWVEAEIEELSVDNLPDRTNMVWVEVPQWSLADLAPSLRKEGVLISMDDYPLRLVTHLDINETGIRTATRAFKKFFSKKNQHK